MDLEKLSDSMPYKWRVQSFSKYKPQGQCVAYIDARDAMKRLDDVCGKENWQVKYVPVNKMLFCMVGIRCGDDWVWKADTGSESNIEKEKGHSSDAFKRACVHWGIGRFLYDMEIKYVVANEKKTNSNYPYVIDSNGKKVWDLTKHINNTKKLPKPTPKQKPVKDSFLDKMKGYAINEPDIYWKVLGNNGFEKATEITNLNVQNKILKEMADSLKEKL